MPTPCPIYVTSPQSLHIPSMSSPPIHPFYIQTMSPPCPLPMLFTSSPSPLHISSMSPPCHPHVNSIPPPCPLLSPPCLFMSPLCPLSISCPLNPPPHPLNVSLPPPYLPMSPLCPHPPHSLCAPLMSPHVPRCPQAPGHLHAQLRVRLWLGRVAESQELPRYLEGPLHVYAEMVSAGQGTAWWHGDTGT